MYDFDFGALFIGLFVAGIVVGLLGWWFFGWLFSHLHIVVRWI